MATPLPPTTAIPSLPMWTEVFGFYINAGMLILGIIGAYLVIAQLKKLTEANQNANLMLVIQAEVNIATARHKIAEAKSKIFDATQEQPFSQDKVDNAEYLWRSAVEEYLNAFDRLCAFIRRGNIDEEVYREDYRHTIADDIKAYSHMFQADTRHHNIVKVHDAWKDGKSAHEKK